MTANFHWAMCSLFLYHQMPPRCSLIIYIVKLLLNLAEVCQFVLILLRENLPVSCDSLFCPVYPKVSLAEVSWSNIKAGNSRPLPQAHKGKALLFSSFWDLIITHWPNNSWAELLSLVKYFQLVQSLKIFQSYLLNSVYPKISDLQWTLPKIVKQLWWKISSKLWFLSLLFLRRRKF